MTTEPQRLWARRLARRVGVLLAVLALALFGWIVGARVRAAWVENQPRVAPDQVVGKWVQAGEVQVHLQEWGSPDGKPLLLVHGTGAWTGTWISNAEAMAAAGYRVVALDLPPFGYSTLPAHGDYSRAAQARRIQAVMRHMGEAPLTLLGHSFGGGPAAEAAMLDPGRVSHLVLVDAAIGLQATASEGCSSSVVAEMLLGWRPLRTALVAAFATEPVFSPFLLRQFVARTEVVTPERTAIYQQPFHNQDFSAGLGDWAYQFATGCETPESVKPDAFRQLHVPVSLVWGELDSITPLIQAQALAALMPQARLTVLPGVGHIPQIEDVAAFNAAITQVLRAPH